jgi:2-phosphosulfolactate phosphatase
VGAELTQDGYRVRFDWGLAGALALGRADGPVLAVVVDVLSFSTSVSVAMDRGMEVFPYRWRDERAGEYAASVGAVLARGRRHGAVSLSPASIRTATGVRRLVLPSPNGASISAALADAGVSVAAGCLRNAAAVAAWAAARADTDPELGIVVIAAGERWPDESLRPAVEDLWGAGAIIAGLAGWLPAAQLSPEAAAAAAAFSAIGNGLDTALAGSVSGRELIGYGFAEDVRIAAELNGSKEIPLLDQGCFRPA